MFQKQIWDPREVCRIIRHDGQPMAHGHTSDEEIDVAKRCHARIVSGVTMLATSANACLLNLLPISARVVRSPSLKRPRPVI